jgi:hypothetical protein
VFKADEDKAETPTGPPIQSTLLRNGKTVA